MATADWRSYAELRPTLVARVSGRSLRTIRRKIKSGELPSRFADGCRLVPIRSVLELVGEDRPNDVVTGEESEATARQKAADIIADMRRRHG